MTRIIGILSWFDESPTWLASTVASMARICDHVVAVDGRYELYDDVRVVSEMRQHDAIQHAARGAGLGLTLHVPTRPWRDEMEKRTRCFDLAAMDATPHRDWVFVLDGDEVVIDAPPREQLRAYLATETAAGTRVVTALLRDVADPHADAKRTEYAMRLDVPHVIDCRTPRLWRMGDRMRVVGYHFNYVCEDEQGRTIELWGDDDNVLQRARWSEPVPPMVIEHRHEQRAIRRKALRDAYYEDRNETGLETRATLDELEQTGR